MVSKRECEPGRAMTKIPGQILYIRRYKNLFNGPITNLCGRKGPGTLGWVFTQSARLSG